MLIGRNQEKNEMTKNIKREFEKVQEIKERHILASNDRNEDELE